jgi:hypothetical protein
MPSESWLSAWKAYQRNWQPDPDDRGPTAQVSQYDKAAQRWRASINDEEWARHEAAQKNKSRENHLAEADRLLQIMLGDEANA